MLRVRIMALKSVAKEFAEIQHEPRDGQAGEAGEAGERKDDRRRRDAALLVC